MYSLDLARQVGVVPPTVVEDAGSQAQRARQRERARIASGTAPAGPASWCRSCSTATARSGSGWHAPPRCWPWRKPCPFPPEAMSGRRSQQFAGHPGRDFRHGQLVDGLAHRCGTPAGYGPAAGPAPFRPARRLFSCGIRCGALLQHRVVCCAATRTRAPRHYRTRASTMRNCAERDIQVVARDLQLRARAQQVEIAARDALAPAGCAPGPESYLVPMKVATLCAVARRRGAPQVHAVAGGRGSARWTRCW